MIVKTTLRASMLAIGLSMATVMMPNINGVNFGVAQAQEPSESHLAAARRAISVLGATNQFDGILLQASDALKAELIQKNPDIQDLIIATVDDVTISLAGRRGDLETESARVYTTAFTEEDLNAIADFYATETGQKLIKEGPIVTRGLVRAAQIWQQGIARDLAQEAGAELEKLTATATEEEAKTE